MKKSIEIHDVTEVGVYTDRINGKEAMQFIVSTRKGERRINCYFAQDESKIIQFKKD